MHSSLASRLGLAALFPHVRRRVERHLERDSRASPAGGAQAALAIVGVPREPLHLLLAAGRSLRLTDTTLHLLRCHSGALWMTQEDCFDDITLTAGQAAPLDRPGLTLVLAVQDSAFSIEPVSGAGPTRG